MVDGEDRLLTPYTLVAARCVPTDWSGYDAAYLLTCEGARIIGRDIEDLGYPFEALTEKAKMQFWGTGDSGMSVEDVAEKG
ncbi:MAG: hypothetical protein M3198_11780 [Actinomycetota bacterium]|nr:hypothetical protein [Actinomycetota bacterium]